MIKRSPYYLSKMYEEQLSNGEDYSQLNRTICINILNFKYLRSEKFHTAYRFKELETHEELTDVMEVHFIEIPKLPKNSDAKDMLVAWTEFLIDPESEAVRRLEMSIEEIREAKDELIRMNSNREERLLYEMRSKILQDNISVLNEAECKGEQNKAFEIARNLLKSLDNETICKMTGLSSEVIDNLRKE